MNFQKMLNRIWMVKKLLWFAAHAKVLVMKQKYIVNVQVTHWCATSKYSMQNMLFTICKWGLMFQKTLGFQYASSTKAFDSTLQRTPLLQLKFPHSSPAVGTKIG